MNVLRNKKKTILLNIIWMMMFSLLGVGTQQVEAANENFKIIGYLPDYDTQHLDSTVDLAQFTDVNYFSVVPTGDGKLKFTDSGSPDQLKALVEKAHIHNVRVGVSIGGWNLSDNFSAATHQDTLRTFINSIKAFVDEYKLDTVDIDWEYPEANEAQRFETFIQTLKKSLDPQTYVSITVPSGVAANGQPSGHWEVHFTPTALKTADWINIMSYDAQIEGYPNHSTTELHQANLDYWNKILGGNHMNKLVSGIPFYGKAADGSVMTYRNIINEAPEVPLDDEVMINGVTYFINNKQTIRDKTLASIETESGGIMIWAPTMDTEKSSSTNLMKVLYDTVEKEKVSLNRANSLAEEVTPSIVVKKINWLDVLSVLLGLLLLSLGIPLLLGYWQKYLPNSLKGKKLNKKAFAKLIGITAIILGVLFVLMGLTPWWMPLLYVLALIALFVKLLKK
ncbi:glycoside hydrolase family 18 protein [Vagococcus zengguangii]|nr:glycoside hydrolase family 18 protein [Vagococcus zengguangii]